MSDTTLSPALELDLQPLAGRIGAEVRGLRLSGALAPESFAALKAALLRHKVLFIRGQQHLDDEQHQAFGRLFGPLEAHPTVPAPSGTRLLELDSLHGGRADSWHTDVTFQAAFPQVSVLRAVVLPPYGGDTVWANTVAAYESLPEPLKRLAESLRALHGNDYDYAAARVIAEDDVARKRYREVFTAKTLQAEHPVVHVHPETGERALLLGHFVKQFQGLSSSDSRRLFDSLQSHVLRLENTVRWRWAPGDVAIWDNRATQHYAINDYGQQHRVVRRVTVSGTPAVGVDGFVSRPISE
ncbi:TauD/TfdA dioxygenase family protein [Paucibacter sp. M5-1]|uniref:TauD/TfdA dioxygenase family protein n=1 Tax=Paucibacter sp. M5-1 TaxID=3015998 RepID=UPI0022B8CDCB|nr:TauD/TfdA family dioxygenase [Paucibacter sp. M5-1]MCZ7883545.1 TauD/TfdA family dioxygenase [Paucibacter sp. M5-1]